MYLPRLRTVLNRIGKAERSGGDVGGIFAEAVSGDVAGRVSHLREHATRGDGDGQYRRLGDLGQLELVFRTFQAQLRELVAERRVGFVEGFAARPDTWPPVPCPCRRSANPVREKETQRFRELL